MVRMIAMLSASLLVSVYCKGNDKIVVKSPAKNITCNITADPSGHLSYCVDMEGRNVILASPMGIIVNGEDLGENVLLGKPKTGKVNERYKTRGVHSLAVNNYNEAVIPVTGGASKTEWFLDVRVFSDAVAYRYRVPGDGERNIGGESSAWQIMKGSTVWYQSDRKKDYEMPYAKMMPDSLSAPFRMLTSSTFKLPDNTGYLMIGEANLVNYSDMALETSGGGYFRSLFHNSPKGWINTGEITSPWRVTLITKNLNELVNTDLFHNLCPAPAPEFADAPWIKPGKSTWAWMVTGAPKFEEQKKWIDWTSKLGFEYYLIDDGWQKWSDGERGQWEMMKEMVEYAKSRGVELWAWVRTTEVRSKEQRDKYIPKAKEIGLAGLKVDFMGAANPEWVQWYDDILKESAAAELMINFHGANKPTGRERTWPHEMTREAIRGREMGKQPALHDLSLPFSRFVIGHADYTPTDFRPEKLKGSTWAHELAMAVVFTSPLMVLAGDPATYLESEALDFMKVLPSVWDETIVLPGSEIGQLAAFARRNGTEWYIGAINGPETEIEIDLGFLGKGDYSIEEFRDEPGKADTWGHRKYKINRNAKLTVPMNRDGGFVARITKN